MIQLVFCFLCLFLLNCDVLSLGVETKDQTKYAKVNGDKKITYEITLGQDETVANINRILIAAGKLSSTNSDNLAVITFKNQVADIQYTTSNVKKYFQNRISVEIDKDLKVTFTIRNIIEEDFNWKYSCTAVNTYASPIKTVNLVKAVAPKISASNIFHNNHSEFVRLNSKNVDFLCEATGLPTPTVSWDKVTNKGVVIRKWISRGDGNVLLSFDVFREGDAGGYRCTAENDGGMEKKTFYIFPGYIRYEKDKGTSETHVSRIGDRIETYCPMESARAYEQNPDITYTWEKNGSVIEVDQQSVILPVQGLSDFTNYTCTAKNDFGKLTYTVIVKNADSTVTTDSTGNENGSVTPTAEGVNKSPTSSSNIHSGSAIIVTVLHVFCVSVLFMIF